VCLSDSMHGILTHIYKIPTRKIIKIENGLSGNHRVSKRISRKSARKELGLPKSSEVIIYVGRPVRNKGFDALIIAIKELRKKRPDLRCVIAGDVNKVVGRWALCKECAANIILPGFLTRSELGKWYAAADIGVMPSYSEQCSFASMEMMESGLPVVSSDGIGHRDMFNKDTNAFVVSIGNVVKVRKYAKRLSVKIDEALSSSALLRRRFAAYNRKLLTIKYSASVMAEKYIAMFHDILSDSSH
ncbi:MAG: glycosyltransferase, partial [Muribaculaceae bacterium]|nr:glycosyltransferase [Muribaculaceae bacterium]